MKRAFFYHYNKPASCKAGRPQITVHTQGKCLLVDNIECNVFTKGRLRKQQPRFVVAGVGNVEVRNGVAYID